MLPRSASTYSARVNDTTTLDELGIIDGKHPLRNHVVEVATELASHEHHRA
jgi:hypothetical protein